MPAFRLTALTVATVLLGAGAAAAQTYNPAQGGSPLGLLAAPVDGVAYFEARERVWGLLAEEKFAEAEPLAEQLVRDYPRDGRNWFRLGRAKRGLNKHAEAAAAFEKAGPLLAWLGTDAGVEAASAHLAAGNRTAALGHLRREVFDHRSPARTEFYDHPEFASLRTDPAFLEIVGRVDTAGWSRDDGWRRDVEVLHNEVKAVNPDYHDRPFPAEFTRRYEALKRDVPRLSDEQIFVGMQRMLAVLRQGHQVMWVAEGARTPNRLLPLRLYAFPEGIFIIDADAANRALVGSRVLRMGGVAAEALLRRHAEASSVDGDMQHVWAVNDLVQSYYLKGLGGVDGAGPVALTVQAPGGAPRTVSVAFSPEPPKGRQDRLAAPTGVAAPLFLSRLQEAHWEQALPEHDALYVQVNNLLDDEDEALTAFGERLWTVLSKAEPGNLILDLRHNNGGATGLYPELLRTVVAFSRTPGRQVYVLIGRRTYSAAANFITDLERLADPVFVGEASSECCNFYGDPRAVRLPYSGVEGELTAVKWNLSHNVFDLRREMSPEAPVQLTAKDYFAGRDPVMAAVQRLIAARKAAEAAGGG